MRNRWMLRTVMLLALALFFGCGEGKGGGTGGTGGAGSGGASTSTSITTTQAATSSGSGTTTGSFEGVIGHPATQTLQDAQAGDLECAAVGPLPNEDGAFVRKLFVAASPGVIQRANFVGLTSATLGYGTAQPWTVGVTVIAAGVNPDTVTCASISAPETLEEIVTWAQDNGDIAHQWQWNTAGSFQAGDTILFCARMYTDADGSGHDTAIFQCGGPGSCDATDQWQGNAATGQAIVPMSSYGTTYCQWWTVAVDAKFVGAPM